jgi:ABC-type lipoprotein release transport system permease subunit
MNIRKHSRTSFRLAFRRAFREAIWSLIIIGALTSGFSAWILIPSIGSSLQSNLISYSNGVATYMAVQPTGGCTGTCYNAIPQDAIRAISRVKGVQAVYPFAINSTYFVARNFSTIENGHRILIPRARFGETSAVIGGHYGFPANLLALSAGRLPAAEPGFVYQSYVPTGADLPSSIQIGIGKTNEVVMGCYNCPTGNVSTIGPYFNATGVGTIASNSLFSSVSVMWNSTFMTNLLGPKGFNETFGPAQTNYMILKIESVSDVATTASELKRTLESYPPYQLYYDEAFAINSESFVTQVAPLYQVFGLVSLMAVVAVTVLVSYLVAGKRSWEAGMLLTQGWGWGGITSLFVFYFLLLSLASVILAIPISIGASHYFTVSYVLYGQKVSLTASANPFYLETGLLLSLLMPLIASWTVIRRLKRKGLDNILREY